MEFNCPSCSAPHAFPDDQIPATGIVVACTRCATHITLKQDGVAVPPAAMSQTPPPRVAPPTPAVEHAPAPEPPPPVEEPANPTRDMDPAPPPPAQSGLSLGKGAASKPSAGPKPSAPPAASSAPPPVESLAGDAPTPAPPTAGEPGAAGGASPPPDAAPPPPSKGAAARKRLGNAAGQAMEPQTNVPPGLLLPGIKPREDVYTWRDLPRAFLAVASLRRFLAATAGMWLALNGWSLVQWLGGWLGAHVVGLLGTIFNIAAWVVLVAGYAIVGAVLGYICQETLIEGRSTTFRAGIDWVKQNKVAVVGTPIAFASIIGAVYLAEYLVGLLGRIPFAGPIVWGVVSPATVLLSLAAGLAAVGAAYALPLYVALVHQEKTDLKQTLRRLGEIFRGHGFALVLQLCVTALGIAVVAWTTVWPAVRFAHFITTSAGTAGMGESLTGLVASAPGAFPIFLASIVDVTALPGITDAPGFGHTLGGIFGGLGAATLPAAILGGATLIWYAAGAILYASVTGRKKVG